MTHKHKHYIVVLLVSSILVLLTLAITIPILLSPPSPSRAFRRFVCDPIPKSVNDIKMDRHVELLGLIGKHRYVFYFRIDEAGLLPILNSGPFKEVQYIEYTENGLLWWGENPMENRHGLPLYTLHSGETDPEWFSLEQWDNPKVYVWEEENVIRMRFLVYNEKLGEAYFIDHRVPD